MFVLYYKGTRHLLYIDSKYHKGLNLWSLLQVVLITQVS